MRVRPRVGSSSPRPLASGFSASRTSRIARPRLATLRRWRRTARRWRTRGLPGRWCASTRIQSNQTTTAPHAPFHLSTPLFLADACQVAYGGHPHLVRPLQGPGWRLDPVHHPGRHRHHHLPHVGDTRFGPTHQPTGNEHTDELLTYLGSSQEPAAVMMSVHRFAKESRRVLPNHLITCLSVRV